MQEKESPGSVFQELGAGRELIVRHSEHDRRVTVDGINRGMTAGRPVNIMCREELPPNSIGNSAQVGLLSKRYWRRHGITISASP